MLYFAKLVEEPIRIIKILFMNKNIKNSSFIFHNCFNYSALKNPICPVLNCCRAFLFYLHRVSDQGVKPYCFCMTIKKLGNVISDVSWIRGYACIKTPNNTAMSDNLTTVKLILLNRRRIQFLTIEGRGYGLKRNRLKPLLDNELAIY